MTCDRVEPRLSELVDGTLQAAEAAALTAHLRECERCRAAADDLAAIRRAASTLERPAPPAAVWTRIAAALGPDESGPSGAAERGGPAPSPARPRLALALATLVVAVAIGGLWIREARPPAPPLRPPELAVSAPPAVPLPGADAMAAAARDYTTVIDGLERIARADSQVLAPDIEATLTANLAIMDRAIDATEVALEAEPGDESLQRALLDVFGSKVELLEQMVGLINELRGDTADEGGNPGGERQNVPF